MITKRETWEAIADALGVPVSTSSGSVKNAPSVEGLPGTELHLPMRYSHEVSSKDQSFSLACYKVAHNLYMAVAVETSARSPKVTVLLLDKALWQGKDNFTTAANRASVRRPIDSLEGWLEVFGQAVVSAWVKTRMMSDEYRKVKLKGA